jgi:hypothetical protein
MAVRIDFRIVAVPFHRQRLIVEASCRFEHDERSMRLNWKSFRQATAVDA